jgi:ketosteroid isomerase-like protein
MSEVHRQLIESFYQALQRRDGEAMAACYHAEAKFEDEVFVLEGKEPGDMWRMLCSRGKDLRVEYCDVKAEGNRGSTHWEAWYTFSATGRMVHNIIDAEFEFKDGKIHRQRDRFDFWRWTRQALGPIGLLLGWSPALRKKVRAQARKGLDAFQAGTKA